MILRDRKMVAECTGCGNMTYKFNEKRIKRNVNFQSDIPCRYCQNQRFKVLIAVVKPTYITIEPLEAAQHENDAKLMVHG